MSPQTRRRHHLPPAVGDELRWPGASVTGWRGTIEAMSVLSLFALEGAGVRLEPLAAGHPPALAAAAAGHREQLRARLARRPVAS